MNKLALLAAASAFALCESAAAQWVPVEWDAAGQFSKQLAIAPGKFVEVCEKLPKGVKVTWSFEAATPLDFNIHYHEGQDVRYPAKRGQVAQDSGTLATTLEQDYCWMWTNKGPAEAALRLKLAKG